MTISEAVRLRALAAEALTIGATMTEPNCKRMMIKLAASYERLAEHAEKREAARPCFHDEPLSSPRGHSDMEPG